jgi:hypothetical protein
MRAIKVFGTVLLLSVAASAADEKKPVFQLARADIGKVPGCWQAAKTGKGDGSVWKVVEDATAPSKSGLALAQTAAGPGALFNVCVADESSFKDVEIIVSFKAIKGELDQGGGVVWRYQDADNYYVARLNPLEDNFRVYKVVAGKRSKEFQSAEVKVKAGEWHSLKIKQVGEHIECFLDGKEYLDVKDDAITKAGKVGVWTKADAQTHFDQFVAKEPKR